MSQPSGYVEFRVYNKKLYDDLTKLGLCFPDNPAGFFSEGMVVQLPSGEYADCGGFEGGAYGFEYLYPGRFSSMSAWVVFYICFTRSYGNEFNSLMELLKTYTNNQVELDEEDEELESLVQQLDKSFSAYDGEIEQGYVKFLYSYDEPGHIAFDIIRCGKREKTASDWDGVAFEEFNLLPAFPVENGVEAYLAARAEFLVDMEDEDELEPEYQVWKNGRWEKDEERWNEETDGDEDED